MTLNFIKKDHEWRGGCFNLLTADFFLQLFVWLTYSQDPRRTV